MKYKTVGFNSEQNRFYKKPSEDPGPGSYEKVEESFNHLKDHKSHNKAE